VTVTKRWTGTRLRSRRLWDRWGTADATLAAVDPFDAWNLNCAIERKAFAALTVLAAHDSDAFSAWCAKSIDLWTYRMRGTGRLARPGATLGALGIAMASTKRSQLEQAAYPFLYVMQRARDVERSRTNKARVPPQLASARQDGSSDGMDSLVALIDTVDQLTGLVDSLPPRHQPPAHQRAATLLEHFLGAANGIDADVVYRARWRIRKLQGQANRAAA
jgi:hypothetical protein